MGGMRVPRGSKPPFSAITFHRSHTDLVTVSELDRVADKINFSRFAAVFSSRPVEPEEVVFFRCKRNAPFEHKKSSVGFTEYDPRTLDYDQFLKEFSQIPKGRIIIINTADADKKNPDDHCIHYDAEGTVYYGVNGLLDTTLEITRKPGRLWMYFVIGSLSEVDLVDNPFSPKVFERYLQTARRLKNGYKSVISAIHVNKPGLISRLLDSNKPMLFHKVQMNFATYEGRKAAEALDTRCNVAFSSNPITIGDALSFTVESTGRVRLGLLSHSPEEFSEGQLSKKFTEQQFGPPSCEFLANVKFATGDYVTVALIKPDGSPTTALVGTNGEYLLSKKLSQDSYYVVFRCENVAKLIIIDYKSMESEEVTRTVIPNPQCMAEQQIYHFEEDVKKKKSPVEAVVNKKQEELKVVDPQKARLATPFPELPVNPPPAEKKKSPGEVIKPQLSDSQMIQTTIFDKILWKDLTVIKKLGSGAQGEVKMVSSPLLGRKAAKIFTHSSELMSKYEKRELETLAKLNSHPFIISIHGFIFDSEHSPQPKGFLMELMDNGCMYNVVHDIVTRNGERKFRVRIEKPHLYNWIQQAASAFHFMHSAGILHRDIKTLNMLLTNDHEQLRICDLGLSGQVQLNNMTMRIGTYLYMAPEVLALAGDGPLEKHYDSKCDVYSLGICMWEMWHRRLPYSNETDSEHLLIRRVCREGYRPVIKPELGGGTLPELIKKCWAPNPKDRPSMLDICKIAHAKLVELEKGGYDLRIRSSSSSS